MTATTTVPHDQLNWWHAPGAAHFHDDQIPHTPLTEDQTTWVWCEPWGYGGTLDAGRTSNTGGERLEPAPTGEPRYDVAFTHGGWSEQHAGCDTPRTLPDTDETHWYESTVIALSTTGSGNCWWNTTHHEATTSWSDECECAAGVATVVCHSLRVSNVYYFYSTAPASPVVTNYRRSVLEVDVTAATDVIRPEYDPEQSPSPQRVQGEECGTAVGFWGEGR